MFISGKELIHIAGNLFGELVKASGSELNATCIILLAIVLLAVFVKSE